MDSMIGMRSSPNNGDEGSKYMGTTKLPSDLNATWYNMAGARGSGMRLTGAATLASLCLRFALAPRGWTRVLSAPPRLRQKTSFWHLTTEAGEDPFNRIAWLR